MDIQVIKRDNSLKIERGDYTSWLKNALSDAICTTLINEGSAVLTTKPTWSWDDPNGGGGGGGGVWGSITGTMSAQTDLNNALNAKASLAVGNQFTKNQYGNTGTATYGTTVALDLSIHKHVITTAGNFQLIAPTNQPAAGFICSGILEVIQGATGGSLSVLNTFWKVTGGTVPSGSTGTGKKDIWAYSVENGVGYLVQVQKDAL